MSPEGNESQCNRRLNGFNGLCAEIACKPPGRFCDVLVLPEIATALWFTEDADGNIGEVTAATSTVL